MVVGVSWYNFVDDVTVELDGITVAFSLRAIHVVLHNRVNEVGVTHYRLVVKDDRMVQQDKNGNKIHYVVYVVLLDKI